MQRTESRYTPCADIVVDVSSEAIWSILVPIRGASSEAYRVQPVSEALPRNDLSAKLAAVVTDYVARVIKSIRETSA